MISIKPLRLSLLMLTMMVSLYTLELGAQVTPPAVTDDATTPTLGSAQDIEAPPESAKAKLLRQDRVIFLLSGYEHFPSRAELDGVGSAEQLSALLVELEANQQSATLRLRAIDAMGYYTTPAIISRLNAIIDQDLAPSDKQELRLWRSMRRHAVVSLARSQGQGALKSLAPLLSPAQDFQLQLTVISAIGKHTGPAGLKQLRAYRQTPALDPLILQELHKHLRD